MNKELTLQDKLRLLRFGKVDKQYLENKYYDEIEKALENYQDHEKILNDYGFTLANFREACFTLAQFRGSGFTGIEKKIEAYNYLKILHENQKNNIDLLEKENKLLNSEITRLKKKL